MKIRLKLDTLLVLEDNSEVRYNPEQWVKDESGKDLPKELCAWDGEKVVDNRLAVEKIIRKDYIGDKFENEIANGNFLSESLSIDVDYRRSGTKNDLQNVEALISYMEINNIPQVVYKGFEYQSALATLQQLKDLRLEMQAYGVYLYGKKDALKKAIDQATTIEEVDNIDW